MRLLRPAVAPPDAQRKAAEVAVCGQLVGAAEGARPDRRHGPAPGPDLHGAAAALPGHPGFRRPQHRGARGGQGGYAGRAGRTGRGGLRGGALRIRAPAGAETPGLSPAAGPAARRAFRWGRLPGRGRAPRPALGGIGRAGPAVEAGGFPLPVHPEHPGAQCAALGPALEGVFQGGPPPVLQCSHAAARAVDRGFRGAAASLLARGLPPQSLPPGPGLRAAVPGFGWRAALPGACAAPAG